MTHTLITPELVEFARSAFYNNQGDETDDPFRLMLEAVFARAFGDEEQPRYTTKRLRYEVQQMRERCAEIARNASGPEDAYRAIMGNDE